MQWLKKWFLFERGAFGCGKWMLGGALMGRQTEPWKRKSRACLWIYLGHRAFALHFRPDRKPEQPEPDIAMTIIKLSSVRRLNSGAPSNN